MISIGHLTPQDELLAILSAGIASYLEVGVREGDSLRVVLRHAKPDHVVLCDTWGSDSGGTGRGSHDHIVEMIKREGLHQPTHLRFLDRDSRIALPLITETFELVHIDGGHSREVALSDFRHGWRLCHGVMVVHDIEFTEGVWPAFFAFMQETGSRCEVRAFFGGHGTAVVRRLS